MNTIIIRTSVPCTYVSDDGACSSQDLEDTPIDLDNTGNCDENDEGQTGMYMVVIVVIHPHCTSE